MNVLKRMLVYLKRPPWFFILILYLCTISLIVLSIVSVVQGYESFWVYIVYVLAFIFLFYSVYILVITSISMKNRIIDFLNRFKFSSSLIENYGFRTFVFSTITSILNLSYAIFMGIMAIFGKSIWYGALSIYYIMLSIIKISILTKYYNNRTHQDIHRYSIRLYRLCGILFIFLTLALSGAILQMIIFDQGFKYADLMVYAVAAFSVYKIVLSIVNLYKARKNRNYTVQSLRNINLTSAMVTLLSLQTTLLAAFSDGNQNWKFNAITGSVVCMGIVLLGVYMIIRANKSLKEINIE